MVLNIHVLLQAGVFIGVYVVIEAPSKSIAMPAELSPLLAGPGGADLPLKLLPIVEAEHQSVFAQHMEPALWQASGLPKVVCGPAGGPRGVGEWAGLAQLRRPGTVADAVGRFLAEWAS